MATSDLQAHILRRKIRQRLPTRGMSTLAPLYSGTPFKRAKDAGQRFKVSEMFEFAVVTYSHHLQRSICLHLRRLASSERRFYTLKAVSNT